MTASDRERLVEVMAREHAGEDMWNDFTYEERRAWIEFHDKAIAAAERAGFRIEAPSD